GLFPAHATRASPTSTCIHAITGLCTHLYTLQQLVSYRLILTSVACRVVPETATNPFPSRNLGRKQLHLAGFQRFHGLLQGLGTPISLSDQRIGARQLRGDLLGLPKPIQINRRRRSWQNRHISQLQGLI